MIEITQPHISSKALLENLAARDQENQNPWHSARSHSQSLENWREPDWLKGNKVPKPCFSSGLPTIHLKRHERSRGCFFRQEHRARSGLESNQADIKIPKNPGNRRSRLPRRGPCTANSDRLGTLKSRPIHDIAVVPTPASG